MAKKALLGVLERTIGKFVKDLDAEKLNLGIWSGKVELHDLQLDVAACNAELDRQAAEAPNLAVPIQVVGGSFASLQLEIPWTSLTSKSVVMKARGLHIQVEPHDRMNETDFMRLQMASEAKRAEHIRQAREQSLQVADLSRLQTNELMKLTALDDDSSRSEAEKESQQAGFVAKLVKRIVENLQVDISDVQVLLEGPEGTAGVCLGNFSFVTTDMAGHRTFVDRANNDNPSDLLNKFLYKKLKLEGFGLFVEETGSEKHNYILDPMNFEAKFREAEKSIVQEYPKYLLKSTLPSVQLALSQRQYQQAVALAAAIAPSSDAATPLFPQYRPLRRISKDTAKDWWKYAYRCVGRMNGKRSWHEFMMALRLRQKYIPLFKRHAHSKDCPWLTPLSKEEEKTLKEIEEDRTILVEGIMAWRNIADAQAEKEKKKHDEKEGNKKTSGWSIFGGKKSKTGSDEDTPISLSTEELKELESVGMEEIAFGQELSNDSKLCSVEFVLNELGIQIYNASDRAMMALKMGRVSTKFDADAGGSFEFGYALRSLHIVDQMQTDASLFPSILRSIEDSKDEENAATKENESPKDAFEVHVSKSRSGDKKLAVKLIPFEAVFAPHLLTELVDFTKMPPANQEKLQSLRRASMTRNGDGDREDGNSGEAKDDGGEPSDYTDSLSNALVEAWREKTEEKTSLSIDLDLQAPVLVLPEKCTDPEASVLVFDFGRFRFRYGTIEPIAKVTKWFQDNPRSEESNNLSTRSSDSKGENTVVDHGRMEMEHMTYLVGKAETWERMSSVRDSHNGQQEAIIEPITVRFDFAVESAISSSIPRVCTFAEMPASNFKLSPSHVSKMLRVYNSWMETLDILKDDNNDGLVGGNAGAIEKEANLGRAIPPAQIEEIANQRQGEVVDVECDEVNKAVETSLGKDTSLFTTMYLEIATETYSFVLYDSGEFQPFDETAIQPGKANIAEGLVLAGAMNLSIDLASDRTGGTTSVAAEINAREFQAYSGFGRDLKQTLQILEPVTGTLEVDLITQGDKTKKADLKARVHNPIDISVSMSNLALINAIVSEVSGRVSECLKKSEDITDTGSLDQNEQEEIELIATSLEDPDSMQTAIKVAEDQGHRERKQLATESASSSIILVDFKFLESKLTIINDLQGLDEALFRINMEEFVTKSTIATMQDLEDRTLMETTYDIKLHTQFLADYYDASVNLWKDLLQDPWKVSVKAVRDVDKQSKCGRFSTKANVHSMPLNVAFSENFLISLAAANHMFVMSSEIKERGNAQPSADPQLESHSKATRHLVSQLPYAIDNCSGLDIEFSLAAGQMVHRSCPNGTMKYFRVLPPKGKGHGGKRSYGQDNLNDQSIKLLIGDSVIDIECLDRAIGLPKRAHTLKDSTLIITNVVKEGRSTVLRVASNLSVQNRTPVPMKISISTEKENINADNTCLPTYSLIKSPGPELVPYDVKDGTLSKRSYRLGFPTHSLLDLRRRWQDNGTARLEMNISPHLSDVSSDEREYCGMIELKADLVSLQEAKQRVLWSHHDVVCTPADSKDTCFVLRALIKTELVDEKKLAVIVTLEPRAQLVNTMPVRLTMLTKKPYALSPASFTEIERKDMVHDLKPGERMEIFSSGDSLHLKARCSDNPAKGTPTGTSEEWIRVPLTSSTDAQSPISCILPFEADNPSVIEGIEFFVAEANNSLPDYFLEQINEQKTDKGSSKVASSHFEYGPKRYLVTVGSYGIDHTKNVLFEQITPKARKKSNAAKQFSPFGSFVNGGNCSITLLPTAEVPIRIIASSFGETKKSAYFRVGEVSMSAGGAQATPLMWEDQSPSGFYAYRTLVSSYQSELHIIPEFLLFNGSQRHAVVVKQANCGDIKIEAGKSAPVFMHTRKDGLPLSFHYEAVDGATKTVQVENLGLHVEVVRSEKKEALGSVAIQTAIGAADSRLVIRIGELGELEREKVENPMESLPGVHPDDMIRFRIQADKLTLTLNEAIPLSEIKSSTTASGKEDKRSSLTMLQQGSKSTEKSLFQVTERPVCTMIATDFYFDIQRLFKEQEDLRDENDISQRCQVAVVMNDFQIKDERPDSPFPIAFDYTGSSHFIDLCVRTKGPLFARNVKIDLMDMILANSSGNSSEKSKDKMILQTNEDFVWKLLDTAAGIAHAQEHGSADRGSTADDFEGALTAYIPNYDASTVAAQHFPPQVSTIYDISKAKVSPFTLVVSFKRRPHAERYESLNNTKSAHLMRYFTQQLKFTVDSCKLKFSRYEENNLRGPIDRLIEILTTVYVGRIKLKLVAILSAVSFADWKNLAARDDGDDEFVDGDILRVTGTLAGNSVGYVFNKVGRGVNKGVAKGFGAIGGGIENATALIGARDFGQSVNTIVTGIGGGVGGTLQGVGEGAGSVVKGTGKGIGQFFGGIGGGGMQMAKGLGKGIVTGDGKAITSGFKKGAKAMGSGVKGSATSVGTGVGSGVSSLTKGTVGGVRSSVTARRESVAKKNKK